MQESSRHIPINVGLVLHQAQLRSTIPLNNALSGLGLTARHFAVMLLMKRDGVCTQRDLVARLITEKTAMVRVISDLDKLGYITRTQSAEDKRLSILGFSKKGERALEEAIERTQQLVDTFFAPLTPDEIELFEDMLSRLIVAPQPTLSI